MSAATLSPPVLFNENVFSLSLEQLPKINLSLEREIMEEIILPDGQKCLAMKMRYDDAVKVHAVSKAECENPKHAGLDSLLNRSLRDIQKMLAKGSILGICFPNGGLGAVGGISPVADPGDMGRGKAYNAKDCPPSKQLYFKMAVVHPAIQEYKLGLIKTLYPHRMADALVEYPQRTCLLTKTNNPSVEAAYTSNAWKKVDDSEVDGKMLYTYKISRLEGLLWLHDNKHDIFQRYALDSALEAELAAQKKIGIAANENHVITTVPQQVPVFA